MEQFEDVFLRMFEDIGAENDPNLRENMIRVLSGSLQPLTVGKSAAEITEINNQTHNFIDNICNRINIPLELKVMDEKEFLFYKLMDDNNICPKLKSWNRDNGQFLIK
jgi:hypothetical protein